MFQFRFHFNIKKNFQPQTSDYETVLADQTDNFWNPDWSHPLFIIITTDILSAAIFFSIHKDYVRVTPLTIDATALNYNTLFNDSTGNSLNSKFINTQETLMEQKPYTRRYSNSITF